MASTTTIRRRILFYQVLRDGRPVKTKADFDFESLFRRVDSLSYDEAGREDPEGDESALTCYVDGAKHIRFGRIRRRNLPSRVDGKKIDEIPLARNGGLLEYTNLVYFEPGIIGSVFNFYAPRATRLGTYLQSKAKLKGIEIIPIVKQSAIEDLKRFQSIRRFTVKVATDYVPTLRRKGLNLFSRIGEAGKRPGIEFVEFALSSPSGKRSESVGADIVKEIFGLAKLPNLNEGVTKFTVEGYFPNVTHLDAVDVLSDELVSAKDFVRESVRNKSLDDEDAYKKVAQAYTELRPQDHAKR